VKRRRDEADGCADAVARLASRYELSAAAEGQLTRLLALLADDPLAPTTVRKPRQVLDDHLADSLVALELGVVSSATQIADLGAGAGLPGLPLAIGLPSAEVSLIESSRRKCSFIARAIESCPVLNAAAVCVRAEAWPAGLRRFDLVTARALAPLPVVAEYAAPLLKLGGSLVVWRGRRDLDEESAARQAAEQLGLEMRDPLRVQPYSGALHRHLQPIVKVAQTPARFPRRPGMARKRPLPTASSGDPSDRHQR
jgi:16S rRNA (guanine527-N7)-methyltransferase